MYNYLFDAEIHRMLTNFYNMCGIRVGIHDADMTILVEYPPISDKIEELRFCDIARQLSPEMKEKCKQCDLAASIRSRESKNSCVYHCHMGFLEALIPIKINSTIHCFLIIGQVRCTNDHSTRSFAEKLAQVCPSTEEGEMLLNAYDNMIVMDEPRFEALAYFLEICAQSIYDKRLIRKKGRALTDRLIEYVDANLNNEIHIADASKELNVSISYLSKIIAGELGTTFTKYLNQKRIEAACRLLLGTDMTVSEIALCLHYEDPSYFMRIFKKHTNMTCSEYRQHHSIYEYSGIQPYKKL